MEFYAGVLATAVLLVAGYFIWKRNSGDKPQGAGSKAADDNIKAK